VRAPPGEQHAEPEQEPEAECERGDRRALPNSAAVANRSAGTGASARRTASSTASGTLGRARRTLGGGSVRRRITIACGVGAANGGSPASISYATAPSE
jgi:hypothetical protein